MTISINQITSGMGLLFNNDIFLVTDYEHVKPGKGSAFVRVKLKNIKTDQVLERTFKTADKLEDVMLEEKPLENLYQSGDSFYFMDHTTFEQHIVPAEDIGDNVKFLRDNLEVTAITHNNQILKINLPIFIECEVTHTEPGVKGDSSKAGTKPATVDTGANVQVPLFIDIGDRIKIDTRTGEYVERVKK